MILATLGTHPRPMDRLVRKIDELAASVLDEPVWIQSAAFGYAPEHCRALGVLPPDALMSAMREASVVITHGGPGLILMALATGHPPIVVPRDDRFGEHVDDHQIKFTRWLAGRRPIRILLDVAELWPAIQAARGHKLSPEYSPGPSREVIDRLAQIIK